MEKLQNGATIIEKVGDVVLCKWRNEYVTWRVDNELNAYLGHYFREDFLAAAKDFDARCKRN